MSPPADRRSLRPITSLKSSSPWLAGEDHRFKDRDLADRRYRQRPVQRKQAAIGLSKDIMRTGVSDDGVEVLVFTFNAVMRPVRSTHSAAASIRNGDGELLGQCGTQLHVVLRGECAAVQDHHPWTLTELAKTDCRTVLRRNQFLLVCRLPRDQWRHLSWSPLE
jgi:hypothetical protein